MGSPHSVEGVPPFINDIEGLPVGEYHVLALGHNCPVAMSTLSDVALADAIAELRPGGLSIVGKTETENIGIEKVIKTVMAVPSIKVLILCGKESGHFSGDTLVSLAKKGVDKKMKVIDTKGKRPILANTTMEEVNSFRSQVEIIDMIECDDLAKILAKLEEVAGKAMAEHPDDETIREEVIKPVASAIEIVTVKEKDPKKVRLDKAGYFVIVPKAGAIFVEHYSNANQLLHILKGEDARSIYWTLLDNQWVTELSHAAYLGKELAKAEMSIKLGFKYVQDKG